MAKPTLKKLKSLKVPKGKPKKKASILKKRKQPVTLNPNLFGDMTNGLFDLDDDLYPGYGDFNEDEIPF